MCSQRATVEFPFKSISGRIGDDASVVFWKHKSGATYIRQYKAATQPNSADQQWVRAQLATVSRAWHNLTEAQAKTWNEFAALFYDPMTGQQLFSRCSMNRLLCGQTILTSAPAEPPPLPISSTAPGVAVDPTSISVTLTHGISVTAGLKVFAKTTSARTAQQIPRADQARACKGLTGAASVFDLPATGQALTASDIRYTIADALYYGIELTVIRLSDGQESAGHFSRILQETA